MCVVQTPAAAVAWERAAPMRQPFAVVTVDKCRPQEIRRQAEVYRNFSRVPA